MRGEQLQAAYRSTCRRYSDRPLEEGATGSWEHAEAAYAGIVARLPRYPDRVQIEVALDEMQRLREEVVKMLEAQLKSENMHGNAIQDDRHIQNSNTESIHEFEPSSRKEQGEILASEPQAKSLPNEREKAKPERVKAFPLGMVLRACPQIANYGPGGLIENWREMMKAAIAVRSMLGVSTSAYEEACNAMGPENAAAVVACILERSNFITSAGGYLRDLTRRSERGEFSLRPMLMALMKVNDQRNRRSA